MGVTIRKNSNNIVARLNEMNIPRHSFDDKGKWINVSFNNWKLVDTISDNDFDCGTNEELFFALVAYKPDYNRGCFDDRWQLFTDDEHKLWQLNDDHMISASRLISWARFHKATPCEIIEHYIGKNADLQ